MKEWNEQVENLLTIWNQQIVKLSKNHYKYGYKQKRIDLILTIFTLTFLSGIITSTINSLFNGTTLGLIIFQLCIELVSIIILSIDKFINLSSQFIFDLHLLG